MSNQLTTFRRCVECGRICSGKVHVGCALYRMGEVDGETRRKMVDKEISEYGVN